MDFALPLTLCDQPRSPSGQEIYWFGCEQLVRLLVRRNSAIQSQSEEVLLSPGAARILVYINI